MRLAVILLICMASLPALSKDYKTIQQEVDDAIDRSCSLHQDADRVFMDVSNRLIDQVNSRVSSILDAFQLDCLSDLLRLGDLGIPGFGNMPNLDFCEIVRSQILSGSGGGVFSLGNMPKSEQDDVKRQIQLRYQEHNDLIKQLEGSDND